MAEVIILRGVSGAGKSFLAEKLYTESIARGGRPSIAVVSADHFMVDGQGEYAFDPRRLQECHGKCLARFINMAQAAVGDNGTDCIIVDNTNATLWEVSPYINVALAYGHTVRVITLICDLRVAHERSQHGTPAKVLLAKDAQLRESAAEMPSWWRQEVRFV
jgi:hypothetical protein